MVSVGRNHFFLSLCEKVRAGSRRAAVRFGHALQRAVGRPETIGVRCLGELALCVVRLWVWAADGDWPLLTTRPAPLRGQLLHLLTGSRGVGGSVVRWWPGPGAGSTCHVPGVQRTPDSKAYYDTRT